MEPDPPIHLPCPRCGYNVVGQVLSGSLVCPECGAALPDIQHEPRQTLDLRWQRALPRRPPTRMVVVAVLSAMLLPALILLAGALASLYLRSRGRAAMNGRILVGLAALSGLAVIMLLLARLSKDTPVVFLLIPLLLVIVLVGALVIARELFGVF